MGATPSACGDFIDYYHTGVLSALKSLAWRTSYGWVPDKEKKGLGPLGNGRFMVPAPFCVFSPSIRTYEQSIYDFPFFVFFGERERGI